jgi:hypothetical protein
MRPYSDAPPAQVRPPVHGHVTPGLTTWSEARRYLADQLAVSLEEIHRRLLEDLHRHAEGVEDDPQNVLPPVANDLNDLPGVAASRIDDISDLHVLRLNLSRHVVDLLISQRGRPGSRAPRVRWSRG